MPTTIQADASPEKRLFISLLTRDITLEAAFLDLIDNSINSALEPFADSLRTADDYVDTLHSESISPSTNIALCLSPERIHLVDRATGISFEAARYSVFRFGRPQDSASLSDRLSVYGLGLKRAFFKIGRRIRMVSDHVDGGFVLELDVEQWSAHENWKFEITPRTGVDVTQTGTEVEILDLHPDVQMRLRGGSFVESLLQTIGETYAFFLTKFVRISVNRTVANPASLFVSENRATDRFEIDGVTCTVTAGIGSPDGGVYRDKGAGWFVFCNGRAVISGDKSSLTGWNNNGLPIFQPKHRPFLGLVYFVSDHPDRLPWDTTKSSVNVDSEIWQRATRSMVIVGKAVTSFLNDRYSDEGDQTEKPDLRRVATERTEAIATSVGPTRTFERPAATRKTTIRIQYDAKIDEVKQIRKHLARPGMSGSEVGRYVLDFFLRNEVETE